MGTLWLNNITTWDGALILDQVLMLLMIGTGFIPNHSKKIHSRPWPQTYFETDRTSASDIKCFENMVSISCHVCKNIWSMLQYVEYLHFEKANLVLATKQHSVGYFSSQSNVKDINLVLSKDTLPPQPLPPTTWSQV